MSSTLFQAIKAGLEEIVVKFNAGLKAYKQATDDSIRQLNTKVDKCVQITDGSSDLALNPNYHMIVPTGRVINTKDGLIAIHEKQNINWSKGTSFNSNQVIYSNVVNHDEQVGFSIRYTMGNSQTSSYMNLPDDIVINEVDGKTVDDVSIVGNQLTYTSSEKRTLKLKTPINWEGDEVQITIGKLPFSDLASTFTGEVVADSGVAYDYTYADDIASYHVSFNFNELKDLRESQYPKSLLNFPNDIRYISVDLGLSDDSPIRHISNIDSGTIGLNGKVTDPNQYINPPADPPVSVRTGDSVRGFTYNVHVVVPLQKVTDGVTLTIKAIRCGNLSHTFETPVTITLPQPTTTRVEGRDFNVQN